MIALRILARKNLFSRYFALCLFLTQRPARMARPPIVIPEGPYYSIDVECVATGRDHNARAVAQISLVDFNLQCLLNLYVKELYLCLTFCAGIVPPTPPLEQPAAEIVSYLTPLTGIDKELLDKHGVPLEEALAILKQALPKNAVLVGQNIRGDVNWLNLKEDADFAGMIDLLGLFRVWNPKFKSWSQFSQDHCAKTLLGVDTKDEPHNAVTDALKSMRLFHFHQQSQADPASWEAAQQALLSVDPEMSFARRNPEFEGCCMGNRKTCKCGGVFFF